MRKGKCAAAGLLAIGMIFVCASCGGSGQATEEHFSQEGSISGFRAVDILPLEEVKEEQGQEETGSLPEDDSLNAVDTIVPEEKEQRVTYYMEDSVNGLKTTDFMTLEAKGDQVLKLIERIELDMTSLDEEQVEMAIPGFEEMVETCRAVEGVSCVGEAGNKTYTIYLEVDALGNAVKELVDAGILQVEGDAGAISLEATKTALEEAGYQKIE